MPRTFPPFEFGPPTVANTEANARFSDYEAVGRKLIAWAKGGPGTWPQSIDALRTEFAGLLTIPPEVKHLIVMQSDDSIADDVVYILRLPAKGQVSESEHMAKAGDYNVPPVIKMLFRQEDENGDDLLPTQVDGVAVSVKERLFHARVADYTMRQCR